MVDLALLLGRLDGDLTSALGAWRRWSSLCSQPYGPPGRDTGRLFSREHASWLCRTCIMM